MTLEIQYVLFGYDWPRIHQHYYIRLATHLWASITKLRRVHYCIRLATHSYQLYGNSILHVCSRTPLISAARLRHMEHANKEKWPKKRYRATSSRDDSSHLIALCLVHAFDFWLLTFDFWLLTSDFWLLTSDVPLTSDFDFWLLTSDFDFWLWLLTLTSDFWLLTFDFWLWLLTSDFWLLTCFRRTEETSEKWTMRRQKWTMQQKRKKRKNYRATPSRMCASRMPLISAAFLMLFSQVMGDTFSSTLHRTWIRVVSMRMCRAYVCE